MPRGERPLELDGSALSQFATDLRKLRANAGSPPYRELARRVHYSSTTLSDAAGGRRLPSLEVALAYVRACGGDVGVWQRRWRSTAAESIAASDESEHESAPYVGLRAYDSTDGENFFGRERLVDTLVQRIAEERFVAVSGPPGCGKSSVLRAGLIPRLTGPVLLFAPGAHPLDECAGRFAELTSRDVGVVRHDLASAPQNIERLMNQAVATESAETEIVIIVDQFEELFTACQDERERSRFISMLRTVVRGEGSRWRVVLGVRSDFSPHSAVNPSGSLQNAQVTVSPMTPDELRRAISQPAIRAQCTVENALLATLVALSHDQPGALPWLSNALLKTWRRRKGNTLTLASFEAGGGFDGALADAAETVFTAFDEHRQNIARDLFLRLTVPGEAAEDLKRRIRVQELDDDQQVAEVVDHFTRARLLVPGSGVLELAHDALIAAWPRLAGWLADDRDGRRVHRELTDATATWESRDRDPGALLRGTRLEVIRDWASRTGDANARERVFIDASITAEELEQETKRRVARRQRELIAALTVLLLLTISTLVQTSFPQGC